MGRHHLLGSVAAAAVLLTPGLALAQSNQELLDRIAALEAQLNDLKAEVAAGKARQAEQDADIIRLEEKATTPAPLPAAAVTADGFRIGSLTGKFGGFIKLDAMASRYDGGDPANGDAVREFYLPGSIPIGGLDEATETDFNARQTRLWLTAEGLVGGHKVGTRLEMDFQVLPGAGDQRTTSPSNLSLRRAFVTVDNWLLGQEWSNFQNIGVLPESADYIGPSEGTVFVRQAQIRYTHGPFSVSIENPETTVTPFGGGARLVADDNQVPDLTARYALNGAWGEFQVAGLLRQLRYENPALGVEADATGWGVSGSGKIKVGARDDLRFMITHGEGIGRYVGLNFTNDAVIDAAGGLEPIGLTAGFAAYRHFWTPSVRSSLIYSFQDVDNDLALTGLGANAAAQSIRGNLVWSPIPSLDIGAEYMVGERELESDATGELQRLQFFAKYGF